VNRPSPAPDRAPLVRPLLASLHEGGVRPLQEDQKNGSRASSRGTSRRTPGHERRIRGGPARGQPQACGERPRAGYEASRCCSAWCSTAAMVWSWSPAFLRGPSAEGPSGRSAVAMLNNDIAPFQPPIMRRQSSLVLSARSLTPSAFCPRKRATVHETVSMKAHGPSSTPLR
jgi:hypothetical protein